jgi:DNA-binding MarR family transcriptional regulator
LNDGNELFIITGGSDNSVLFLSPYTGPTAMYGAGWSAVRIWGSTGNLLAISTGDIDPFNGNDEIVAVDGNKLDTGELYSIVEVWKSGGRWSSCEIFASDTPLYAAIGDFNSSNPGNEVAAAEGNGGVSMLWKPVPGNVWNSTRLWKSPKTLTGAAAADIAGSWTGAELAVAGTASITMLTESTPSVPALSVLSPENYAVVQGSDITIRWAGSNWNGKAFVRLYYSTAGASGPWTVIADNQQPSGSIAWSIPGYTQGATYWLVAVLFDAVGLSASDMVMFYSSHDTQPPQITHDPVTSVYLGDPVVIRAVVVDDTAVASVYIYFRTLGETQYKSGELFSVSASSDETYTITIPPAAVNPPAMEYYITATDTAGNTAKSPPDAPASPYVISVQDKNDTLQLDMVCIHPSDIVVTVGSEVKFEAAALSSGFCRIDAEFSWKFAGSVGTLDGEGRFRATETGKGRVEVTAAYNGVSMTATAAITVINPCFGVRGTVCNTGGKALQSAVVTMKSGDSRWSAGASSDGSGSFAISGIPAGEIYTIHVKKEGYRERTLSGITSGGEVSITLEPVPQAAPGYPVPDEAAPVIFIVIIGGGLLGLAGMMADALKYKLFCVLAPLYSKIEKDKILDNFVRGQVYGHIRTNPGTHYSKIRRVLGIKNGSLAYHLRTLEKSEFVKSRFDGKYKRFYPCGMKIPDGGGMTLSEPQQRIVEVVRKSPGISQSSIGRTLNFRKQSINYHIKQLVGAEVLQVVSIGRETRCYSVCG